jgi:hypothetical protein
MKGPCPPEFVHRSRPRSSSMRRGPSAPVRRMARGDHADAALFGPSSQQGLDRPLRAGVHVGRGFVQDQQRGFRDHGLGQQHPPLLAARKPPESLSGEILHPHGSEGPAGGLRPRSPGRGVADADDIQGRGRNIGANAGFLGRVSDPATGNAPADRSAFPGREAENTPEQGRLSAAVSPGQNHEIPGANPHRNIPNRKIRIVAERGRVQLDQGLPDSGSAASSRSRL